MGPQETLWKEVLDRAGMKPDDQAPFLNLAKGQDLTIQRLQGGQQKVVDALEDQTESLDRLGALIEGAIKAEEEA